jgi:prephenate dehydrogenase
VVQLVVLGFGLIGGSVALASRSRGIAGRVVGVDRADTLALPEARRAADELVDVADDSRVREVLAASDLVVVATPVGAIEAMIGEVLEAADVVTDCGSTKRAILASASRSPRRNRFVAGHPMAGLPQGGIQRARADLFEGRPWLLCPEGSDPEAVERVETLVRGVGAEPLCLRADEHDRAVALTSHVPQILASALAVLAENRRANVAAGPAFESATRVAGGGEAMWRDILWTNADEISAVLDALSDELGQVSRALRQKPADLGPALTLLERARALRHNRGDR